MQLPDDLSEFNVVITGATSGIGLGITKALAKHGAWVIGIGRSEENIQKARQEILAEATHARLDFLIADLSSQRQLRILANQVKKLIQSQGKESLSVLINNAGTIANWFTATEDGYELQFAVNHLAPFLLTAELLPFLQQASASRVITVSSNSHRGMRIHWKDVMFRKGYNTLMAYKQSKLANVLFSYEFNRRQGINSSVIAIAADPGLVNTEIGMKGTHGMVHWIWNKRRQGGAQPDPIGAEVAWLAVAPQVNTQKSAYWKHGHPVQPSRYALREDEAARLWLLSERLCGMSSSVKDYDIRGSGPLVGGA